MDILITGDRGFIGARLRRKLETLGHSVTGYDRIDGMDLLDVNSVEENVRKVDVVLHLAAQADMTEMAGSIQSGRRGVADIVNASDNVAYSCARYDKWLVYASTACIYGNAPVSPQAEDSTLPEPTELYACAKYAGEVIVQGYGRNYDMPWTLLRLATVYGPGMRPALGVNVFFAQALVGEPITVHGDGSQERAQTYVDDVVDGFVACLANRAAAANQVFNLAAREPVSALRMAEDIKAITGSSSPIVFVPQRANQILREHPTALKAERLLGWRAQTSWNDGLERTLAWIRKQNPAALATSS